MKQKSAKDFDGDRIKPGCGCVWCDHGWKPLEGQHIAEDYHRAPNGERIACTRGTAFRVARTTAASDS